MTHLEYAQQFLTIIVKNNKRKRQIFTQILNLKQNKILLSFLKRVFIYLFIIIIVIITILVIDKKN